MVFFYQPNRQDISANKALNLFSLTTIVDGPLTSSDPSQDQVNQTRPQIGRRDSGCCVSIPRWTLWQHLYFICGQIRRSGQSSHTIAVQSLWF